MPLKKLWQKRFKLNNRGSAIVTVIVVTIFITILATTLLFVSGRNYIMKQTNYQNTKSFYAAEETLDKLKELLVAEVDKAFDEAYRDMMRNYATIVSEGDTEAVANDKRFRYYVDSFTKYLEKEWQDRVAAQGSSLAAVKHFMEVEQDAEHKVSPDMTKLITKVNGFTILPIDNVSRFVIRDVQVYYVDDKGFSAYISTDIVLTPPDYRVEGETGTPDPTEPETSEPVDPADPPAVGEPDKVNMSEHVMYVNWKKNNIIE